MNLKSCKSVDEIKKFLSKEKLYANSWNSNGVYKKCNEINSSDILVVVNVNGVQWMNLSSGLYNFCDCGNVDVRGGDFDGFEKGNVFDNKKECEKAFEDGE